MASASDMRFLGAKDCSPECTWTLVGLPCDASSSYRLGAQMGPAEIRKASDSIETYSPYCQKDLEDLSFCDGGNLDFPATMPEQVVATIRQHYAEQTKQGKRLFGLGGDHAVTVGAIQGIVEAGLRPHILQLDAHLDLRDEYDGTLFSHACVGRRLSEAVQPERLIQWGMRSGEKAEFDWARQHVTFQGRDVLTLQKTLRRLEGGPVYISLDLDLFDPSEMPGVGNPEPGGLRFSGFLTLLQQMRQLNLDVIGADVVELAPNWDPSGRSAVMAAEVVRELLLTIIK